MARLTVEGFAPIDVPDDKRLVLAIEQDARVDILHACGGNARCTTCRVEFIDGEPPRMTLAERQVLAAKGLTGVRLSCQMLCDHDMVVRAVSRFAGSGRPDPGPPAPFITPPPNGLKNVTTPNHNSQLPNASRSKALSESRRKYRGRAGCTSPANCSHGVVAITSKNARNGRIN